MMKPNASIERVFGMNSDSNSEFYTKKGQTSAGRPYAIVFEFAPYARAGEQPIRIIGRYEDDIGDYTKFYIVRDPEGGFARYQERPFAQQGQDGLGLDMCSPSSWMLIPAGILDTPEFGDDPRLVFAEEARRMNHGKSFSR